MSTEATPPTTVRLDEIPWPEYSRRIAEGVVILPVGATEQHGHHLPLGTDAHQVTAVAEAAASATGALVAPTIAYGYKSHPRSGGGEIFPGTTSLDATTLIAVIRDILTQLIDDGARSLVVLSGHYENHMMLHEGIDLALRGRRGGDVVVLNTLWADHLSEETIDRIFPNGFPGLDSEHAAVIETSMMLHLHPDLVRMEALRSEGVAEMPPYDRHPQVPGMVPDSGVLSEATDASEEIGKLIFDECVEGLVGMIREGFSAPGP